MFNLYKGANDFDDNKNSEGSLIWSFMNDLTRDYSKKINSYAMTCSC